MRRFRFVRFIAALIAFVLISCIVVDGREVQIKNFYLDVVFMVDQSASMPDTNHEQMIRAIGEWAASFLDVTDANNAHFAVIECNPVQNGRPKSGNPRSPNSDGLVPFPRMKYNFTNAANVRELKDALTSSIPTWTPVNGDWLDFCAFYAVNYTLKPEFGHRKGATIVAIYLTDCNTWENQINVSNLAWNQSYAEAAQRLSETNATCFFLCACNAPRPPCGYVIEDSFRGYTRWQNVLNILRYFNQGNESIILFKDQDLDEQMSKIIPYGKLNVTDCVFRNDSGPCQLGDDARCWKSVNVTPIANATVLNEGIIVINESEKPRQCPEHPIIDKKECECPNGTTPGELAVKPMSIVLIVLPTVGVLLIVIVVLVVVAVLAKRRKKRAVLNKGQRDIVKKEKDQGIGANMTVRPSATKAGEFSTRTLAPKGDKKAAGKKPSPMESARSAASKNELKSKGSKSKSGNEIGKFAQSRSKSSKAPGSESGNPTSSASKKSKK